MKVLYSNPAAEEDQVWLPYTWGRFREYCDNHSLYDLSKIEWLDPIYFGDFNVDLLTTGINFSEVDVLLCSFYVWNEKRQIEIARKARRQNPKILIIGGGPQVQYRPHQNTKLYQEMDFVTPWEGEEVVSEILFKKLNNIPIVETDLLVDPRNPRDTVKAKRLQLKNFKSPFLLYKEDFMRFADKIRAEKSWVATMWETNRGCPYKCSFCDWGSATSDKIRRFSEDEVLQELEAISALKVNYVFNADANFGIFKEDLKYIEKAVELKQKDGWPKEIQFCAAKNKKEISNKAHKLLYDNNMCSGAQISFQHTDGQVLEAIDRSNIKQEKLQEELEEAFKNKIPLVGVVILGNPGDTVEKWKTNLGHMLEIGFHHDLRIHDFMLLPNAPAADPEYIKRYGLKFAPRKNFNGNFKTLYESNFIISTHSYTEKDYAAMQTFSYFITGFHILNISKFIAMFARHYYGIDYSKFYDELSKMPTIGKIYNEVYEHMLKYTFGKTDSKAMIYEGQNINADSFIKAKALENQKGIKQDLYDLMSDLTPMLPEQIQEMIETQSLTWVYWDKPKPTELSYNFGEIFNMLNNLTPMDKSNYIDIIKTPPRTVEVFDFVVGAQWKYDTIDMDSKFNWINHRSNKQPNRREGLFHYQQALEL